MKLGCTWHTTAPTRPICQQNHHQPTESVTVLQPCCECHHLGELTYNLAWCNRLRSGWVRSSQWYFNTLRPRHNGRRFPDDNFKCIFLNENIWISIKMLLKFSPKGPINNFPALVQIMAWRRPDDKPLYEPMMISLLTHICVTWPQCVNACVLCGWLSVWRAVCIVDLLWWPGYLHVCCM